MRKSIIGAFATAVFALSLAVSPTMAGTGNPHVVGLAGTLNIDTDGTKVADVWFKIAGLGNYGYDNLQITGTYSLYYKCRKSNDYSSTKVFRDGKTMKFKKTYQADANGMIERTARLRLAPPACPGGWELDPSYDNRIELNDDWFLKDDFGIYERINFSNRSISI